MPRFSAGPFLGKFSGAFGGIVAFDRMTPAGPQNVLLLAAARSALIVSNTLTENIESIQNAFMGILTSKVLPFLLLRFSAPLAVVLLAFDLFVVLLFITLLLMGLRTGRNANQSANQNTTTNETTITKKTTLNSSIPERLTDLYHTQIFMVHYLIANNRRLGTTNGNGRLRNGSVRNRNPSS